MSEEEEPEPEAGGRSGAGSLAAVGDEVEVDDASETEALLKPAAPQGSRLSGLGLLNLTAVAHAADQVLAIALIKELEGRLALSEGQCDALLLVRSAGGGLAALACGFLLPALTRPAAIGTGSALWAAGLLGCTLCEDFWLLCACRCLSGVGLGLAHPALLILIADLTPCSRRGVAFGTLQLTAQAGAFGGKFVANELVPLMAFSYAAWKCAFGAFAAFSTCVGVLVMAFMEDPRPRPLPRSTTPPLTAAVKSVAAIPTVALLLLHSAMAKFPWAVYLYATLWAEMSRSDDATAGRSYFCMGLGKALAGLAAGGLVDSLARRWPNNGAPGVASLAAVLGVPLLGGLSCLAVSATDVTGPGRTALLCATWAALGSLLSWWAVVEDKLLSDVAQPTDMLRVYAVVVAAETFLDGSTVVSLDLLAPGGQPLPWVAASCVGAWLAYVACACGLHGAYPADRRRGLGVAARLEAGER